MTPFTAVDAQTRLLVCGPPGSSVLATDVATEAWRRGAVVSVLVEPDWSSPLAGERSLQAALEHAFDVVCELAPAVPSLAPGLPRISHPRLAGDAGDVVEAVVASPFETDYARVVVEHSLAVAAGQLVLIEGCEGAAPLARAIADRILEIGGRALVRLVPDGLGAARAGHSSPQALGEADLLGVLLNERADARVALLADADLQALALLPAERVALAGRSRARTSAPLLARAAREEARWVVAQVPLASYAGAAGLTLDAYRELLRRGLKLDAADPIAAWRAAGERQEVLRQLLEGVDALRFVAPGTDLIVQVAGRPWRSSYGVRNLPDGEVFTAPHEHETEGVITFTLPTSYGGRRVENARLRFERGVCVEASATSGEDVLLAALETDPGARRLGEVAFGLNRGIDHPTCDVLLSEKIGGTAHMALGRAYPETGGTNLSDLHWDLVCDLRSGGEVYADGRLIQRDGAFDAELGVDL